LFRKTFTKTHIQNLFIGLAVLAVQATAFGQLTVTNIAQGCAADHSLFLKSDGSLWAMGNNKYGQLGDGTFNNTNKPEQIVASGVTAIAVGESHSLFLKSDGSLWAMGSGAQGQLGDGTFNITNRPEQIVPSGVTAIAAGELHSLFLKSDGSLWAMGYNGDGELGDGIRDSGNFQTNKPEEIVAGGVTAIAAGYEHSLFLKSDGSLWAMGDNFSGELGDGTTDSGNYYTNKPEQILPSGVTAIAAGADFSLFLKSDGSLWAMGLNYYGALGDGTYDDTNKPEQIVASGVTAVAGGWDFSLFLKSDGSLWAMGDNYLGQLGDGTFTTNSPYGTNIPEKVIASGVTAIAVGDVHSLFLKSNGSLWAMGDNYYGEFGDGFSDTNSPYGTATPEQIFPSPPPWLTEAPWSETNLHFNATCWFGGSFYLLAGTNLAQPLSQWTPVWTNVITSRYTNVFSATLTNAVNSGAQQFYILQSQ
jgi:alpha-tubulin suppressor-like RCC1 family protein